MNNPEGIKALVALAQAYNEIMPQYPIAGAIAEHIEERARELESLTAVAEDSRAITALKVTLFETECYLPASIAKRVQAACAVGVAGDAEAVAYISETHAACLAAGKRNGVLVAAEVYSEPAGSLRPLIYGDAAPTRQAVEGMVPEGWVLVPKKLPDDVVERARAGTDGVWALDVDIIWESITSHYAAAEPQAGKGDAS